MRTYVPFLQPAMKYSARILCCILLLVMLTAGCKSPKEKTQGIHGKVYWVEGNRMPQASEGNLNPSMDTGQGVKRTLKIHPLTHLDQLSLGDYLIGTIATPEIKRIDTAEDGSYRVELPIGTYSIFTVEDEGYFANTFDHNNHVNPVKVTSSEWTQFDIVINYKAVY